ncbi:Rad9-domain-containing protein [Mucor lusitanicus]|nr:Rad9-domain-containing protein [Mucor lusitanicus]
MGGYKSIKECQLSVTQGNIHAAHHTESRIYMRILYKNGVTKKNTLWYSNGDPMMMFCKNQYESRVICQPQLIKDFLVRFDHKTQDIEFTCTNQGLVLMTHPENRTVSTGDPPVKSMFVIYKADFDTFDIKKNTKLVINLKEFKSFVDYIEYLGGALELQFESAGMPLLNKYTSENKVVSYMALQTVPPHVYDTQDETEMSFVDTSELDYTPMPHSRRTTPAPASSARPPIPSTSTSSHPQHQTSPRTQQSTNPQQGHYSQGSNPRQSDYQQSTTPPQSHYHQRSAPQQPSTSSNTRTHYMHDSTAPTDSLPSTVAVTSEDDDEPLFTGRLIQRRATQIRDTGNSPDNGILISSSSTSRGSLDKSQRLATLEQLREQRSQRQTRYS